MAQSGGFTHTSHPNYSLGFTRRFALVDLFRGAALIAMIWYHFNWDLRYFGFTLTPIESDFWWRFFQKSIVAGFMVLTGASLVLAYGKGVRWRHFFKREAMIVVAALAITGVTYLIFPDAFVYFGVLHAIALFSLLGLFFLNLPLWLVVLLGGAFFLPPAFFSHPVFNVKMLSWIGFWTVPPPTEDLVPLFPWFGVTLWGQAGMRLALKSQGLKRALAAAPFGGAGRAVSAMGRKSLIVYLVHQPVLFALLFPAAFLMKPETWYREARFAGSCQQSCVAGQGSVQFCTSYCACALDQVQTGDLWAAFAADPLLPEQAKQISQVSRLCTAMAQKGAASKSSAGAGAGQ